MPKKQKPAQSFLAKAPAPIAAEVHDEPDADAGSESARHISVKDVVLAYAFRGVAGLDALQLENKSHLVRRAVALCRVEGNDAIADALVTYANSRGIVIWPGRGRGIPLEGETRSYRAQQLRGQDPFIRLPVSCLEVAKGQAVTVAFKSGVIEVRART